MYALFPLCFTWPYISIIPAQFSTDLHFVLLAQIESNYDEITDSFDSMSLKGELLRGILLK